MSGRRALRSLDAGSQEPSLSRNPPRRRKPWTSAALVSAGLHLTALLALGAVTGRSAHLPPGPVGALRPALAIALVRLPEAPDRSAAASERIPTLLPAMAPSPNQPDPVADAPPVSRAVSAAADMIDIDPLYRAPFLDAVRQAYASLRGGLGCAHVELASLPKEVRALCGEAARLKTAQASTDSENSPANIDTGSRVRPPDSPGPG